MSSLVAIFCFSFPIFLAWKKLISILIMYFYILLLGDIEVLVGEHDLMTSADECTRVRTPYKSNT